MEQDRERARLLKLSTYVLADFIRGLVFKIERESEELKLAVQKRDMLYPINEPEPFVNDFLQRPDYGQPSSNELVVTKDEFFLQIRQKIDLLKQEKRRLTIEIEKTVKENQEVVR